ncbi:MAG: hypothetical protein HY299_15810 [Verrucomicrobia bacterium]|nr:hypothetical protein [Verrucomicrobiota bacterium]
MKMDNNATVDRIGRLAGQRTERFGQVFLPCPEFDSMEREAQSEKESRCEEPDTTGMRTQLAGSSNLLVTDQDFIQLEFGNLL